MDYKSPLTPPILDSGLVIDAVMILKIDEDSLLENLEALYELAYKYGRIEDNRLSEKLGYRDRMGRIRMYDKTELLAIAAAGIYDVTRRVAELLSAVFEDWLDHHAITDPRKWAEARYSKEELEADEFELPDIGSVLEAMYDEYARFHKRGFTYDKSGVRWGENAVLREIAKKLDRMPALTELLETVAREDHKWLMEAWEAGRGDYDTKKAWLADKPEIGGAANELDNIDDFANFLSNVNWDVYPILVEIGEHVMFPVWYARWKAEGIETTRKRIVKMYSKLESIQSEPELIPVDQLIGEINQVINVAHQTGSMIEYIEQKHEGVDANTLQKLSTDDQLIKNWDAELKEMGVHLGEPDERMIASRIVAARMRAETRAILDEAWERLAGYEAGRNPVGGSLQEAVMEVVREGD